MNPTRTDPENSQSSPLNPVPGLSPFDLIVFTCDAGQARQVLAAGAAAVMVDWENQDKAHRQRGADTQINQQGPADLARVRQAVPHGQVLCRVNGWHAGSREEIDRAVDGGADELFLPMVRRVDEAEQFLACVGGRARASFLIETVDAVRQAEALGQLPVHRIYVGLNDLAIDLGRPSIFAAVVEGLLDEIRPHIQARFGFGGLTLPERGSPIPCRLLLSEIVRLRSSFTFLRRSFWRDAAEIGPEKAIPRILEAVEQAAGESVARRAMNREEFHRTVRNAVGTALSLAAVS